ncbi:MAG: hypothetical protein QXN26_04720 [Thermoplasmataceae archaeon]
MQDIYAIFAENSGRIREKLENHFIASQNPLYIGIILKPSHGAWIRMSRAKTVVLEIDGKPGEYSVPYRIEVGENSIFFLKPREED